ncbi:MAG: hypothetical protein AAF657_25840 [Acidobacteriota bacterium]
MYQGTAGTEFGVLAIWDAEHPRPDLAELKANPLMDALAGISKTGEVFWLEVEDAEDVRIDVYVDEELPESVRERYQADRGSFLLRVESGSLAIGAVDHWASLGTAESCRRSEIVVPPGDYVLTCRLRHFAGERYRREMIALVGENDWRFYNCIGGLSALGCLPLIAFGLLALLEQWRLLIFCGLPALALLWIGLTVLQRFTRYAQIDRKIKGYEAKMPYCVLELHRTRDAGSLRGGGIEA